MRVTESNGFDHLRAALDDGAPVVLLTGRAGTGKSHIVRRLMAEDARTPQALLAPTGLAALNIGGQTVHSFFGFRPRALIGAPEKPNWFFTKAARAVRRLVVDEVSMLRADVLDAMDQHLRIARKSSLPFGGVQILLVGDFYQLPPVVRGDEGALLEDAGYETPYAFSARALRDAAVAHVELTHVHRQADADFIALLERIRDGRDVAGAVRAINAACLEAPAPAHRPILLAATNAVADSYNARGLASLSGPERRFRGVFTGEKAPQAGAVVDRLPAPPELVLKPGARVIFTQNDGQGRWVNGSLGQVVGFSGDDGVHVTLDAGETVEVGRASWPQTRWTWDAKENRMAPMEEYRYQQLPLAPAWAITIHKAQGMTLDSLMVDLGRGAFAPGQTYVALSRARSLDGLRLARPLAPRDVLVDPRIAEGLARFH